FSARRRASSRPEPGSCRTPSTTRRLPSSGSERPARLGRSRRNQAALPSPSPAPQFFKQRVDRLPLVVKLLAREPRPVAVVNTPAEAGVLVSGEHRQRQPLVPAPEVSTLRPPEPGEELVSIALLFFEQCLVLVHTHTPVAGRCLPCRPARL